VEVEVDEIVVQDDLSNRRASGVADAALVDPRLSSPSLAKPLRNIDHPIDAGISSRRYIHRCRTAPPDRTRLSQPGEQIVFGKSGVDVAGDELVVVGGSGLGSQSADECQQPLPGKLPTFGRKFAVTATDLATAIN